MIEQDDILKTFKELQNNEEFESKPLGEKVNITNKKLNNTTEILSLLIKQLPELLLKISESHKQLQEVLSQMQESLNDIKVHKSIELATNIEPPIKW